jgi:hypothetical protein
MRTDDFGREIASATGKRVGILRGGRLFAFGLALGIGVCIGMGPPIPLLDEALSATASEPVMPTVPALPRRWLVLRDALLDASVTGIGYAEQQEDQALLRSKWRAVQDALESAWSDRIAAR